MHFHRPLAPGLSNVCLSTRATQAELNGASLSATPHSLWLRNAWRRLPTDGAPRPAARQNENRRTRRSHSVWTSKRAMLRRSRSEKFHPKVLITR
ncbi:MAG: hypothetical protein RMH97_01810 [Verrucomicrobiales bacterium]|nr:hypothetical protein [Verrucomicrobiales bacterium]